MLIDTHCHLTSTELSGQADAVLERARAAGVGRVILVAVTPADARAALKLLAERPELFLVAGIHPHEAGHCGKDDLEALAGILRGEGVGAELKPRIVGVGETGLDWHYDFAPRERQEEMFLAHLALAADLHLPVVIHARLAELRVCEILADFPQLAGRVVFHCFSGDTAVARRVLDLGHFCSLTGVVTFKKADAIRATARFLPDDRILVETDAPYLSPEPVRKQRPNEPAFLVHTVRFLADLRGTDVAGLSAVTTANAVRFFGLPEV
jgi:TatD DNase family protein